MSQVSASTHTSHSEPIDKSNEVSLPDSDAPRNLALDEQAVADEQDQLTLRALVSTKEAGVIIGKGGKNVGDLRDSTGVKAGVSKVVPGVHDRVLTVTGSLDNVAKAYAFITRTLIDNPLGPATPPTTPGTAASQDDISNTTTTTLRLLISHNLMGTVIGRQGAKIKHIQDTSGVRMTASKVLLPQSTERVVEIKGTVDAIQTAIREIGQCLLEDKDRAYGTILYNPTKATNTATSLQDQQQASRRVSTSSILRTGNGTDFAGAGINGGGALGNPSLRRSSLSALNNANLRTQHISIPSDMVGCIIGKGGNKIAEIRRLSGSRISIAKMPHDESGERMFTIQGTAESNERALYLLYGQLENEKERRLRGVLPPSTDGQQQDSLVLEVDDVGQPTPAAL
ncbi:hypothetical protein LRAMOSA02969 [Lichtheimia ramosa]|uniref:K Homology domain-containing protein n=1 Tax=Lichtheimia ramosa TaxID=688394 RepID=A0A077WT90_9FUNG|nr:hypothetical protein LRAMOSA02969 [Lichtheimia ramosa]